MTIGNYGGNIIKSIDFGKFGRQVIATDSYTYHYYQLNGSERVTISNLGAYTIYILSTGGNARVHLKDIRESKLLEGYVIQVEGTSLSIDCIGGSAKIFVAGVPNPSSSSSGISVLPPESIYKVNKPWGHELWFNGEHPGYAFKKIYIKKGTKTSLQYHEVKRETNVLFSGKARLHYKRDENVENDRVTAENLAFCDIDTASVIDVFPPTLHRLEAVTDIILYEASTPHLDDVMRVLDDSNRGDGRIHGEHSK